MWQQLTTYIAAQPLWVNRLLSMAIFFGVALLVHRATRRSARVIIALTRRVLRQREYRTERLDTLRGLVASAVSTLAFSVATLLSLGLFAEPDTILWMVGLFAAAFGLGARPQVSDVLTGVGFLFNDPFDVGEKVELMGNVQGVVEAVHLQNTVIRAQTGELYVVPNGEIRLIRNFSRGRFSLAEATVKLESPYLDKAITLLTSMDQEAMERLPNLLEPWQVLSKSGILGDYTELTIVAKARFGKAAEMRTRLLALINEKLAEEAIELHV